MYVFVLFEVIFHVSLSRGRSWLALATLGIFRVKSSSKVEQYWKLSTLEVFAWLQFIGKAGPLGTEELFTCKRSKCVRSLDGSGQLLQRQKCLYLSEKYHIIIVGGGGGGIVMMGYEYHNSTAARSSGVNLETLDSHGQFFDIAILKCYCRVPTSRSPTRYQCRSTIQYHKPPHHL